MELRDEIIPKLVEERDGRDQLISTMNTRPLRIPYSQLVGTSFTPRSASRCNGIVQAAVKGQGRDFIGDWPADNFIRWAHCFGFIKYNYEDDSFEITDAGLELTDARGEGEELSVRERELMIDAALAYPPAVRILSLLADGDAHLTKFELGSQLGFIGEDGFTSMPQRVFIRSLAVTKDQRERASMKSDWEGSSDKYARMIASWLCKLGLAQQAVKTVTVDAAGMRFSETIGQAYMITAAGLTALRRAMGKSRHRRIPKNVSWEMLSTKGHDREYLRTRRAYILKFLCEAKRPLSAKELAKMLCDAGMEEGEDSVSDDVNGLINIGIQIEAVNGGWSFCDEVRDFVIPRPQSFTRSTLADVKERVRAQLRYLSHEYLSLLDLAYDSKQNRLFEMKVLELLTEECGFHGLHLGGSRKPDGIVYTSDLKNNFGIIIDTKAYSKGYNLPISQADEMERYIGENQTRDEKINPNKWWENFSEDVKEFKFMFVSGHFTGNYKAQLERISLNRGINGTAAAVAELILMAERYKSGELGHEEIRDRFFANSDLVGTVEV